MGTRSFLASLRLRPRVEGRSADVQHRGALRRHRDTIQQHERTAPQHLRGVRTTAWQGGTTPPDSVQNLPDRPPLLAQDPTTGAHEDAFVGDAIPPTAWDGEPGPGAPNTVEGG